MNILLGIGHPADVHFFKHLIGDLRNKNHKVIVAAREKEITYYLLDKLNIEYNKVSVHQKTAIKKILDYFIRWSRTYKLCKKIKPNIAFGVGDFYLPQIGMLQKFQSLVFTDTECVKHDSILTFPFASHIITPDCYKKSLGHKHIKLNSLKELAYLHEKYFVPDHKVCDILGIKPGEKYTIMRFISRTAMHDFSQKGISIETKREALREFKKISKVFISSEEELPEDFAAFQIPIPPEKMHDALYYASMLYGESATMASECACVGTPGIFVDSAGRGYTDEEEKFGLVFNFSTSNQEQKKSILKGIELLQRPILIDEWQVRKNKMVAGKIDINAFMMWFIENYPGSANIMRKNPDFQYQFHM